jgi:hypothetical protein
MTKTRTIDARELASALDVVAKYRRFPGVVARELTDAKAIVAKYDDLERRAARFERAVDAAFLRSHKSTDPMRAIVRRHRGVAPDSK